MVSSRNVEHARPMFEACWCALLACVMLEICGAATTDGDARAAFRTGLERDFGAYLDFEEKLSRSQTLRLVEMLLASAA